MKTTIETQLAELKEEIKSILFKDISKTEVAYELGKLLDFKLNLIANNLFKLNENERKKIITVLGDNVFICTRSLDAWQTNKMTQDDFKLASDNNDLIEKLKSDY